MALYQVWIGDPYGNLIAVADSFLRLTYRRVANAVGTMQLQLPITFPENYLWVDGRIGIYRSVAGQPYALDADTVWFIRDAEKVLDTDGSWHIEVTAYDANYLLSSRIVAYNDEVSQSQKVAAADDMLKAIVRENLGASATDAARSLATYLTIDPDLTQGPSLEKRFAHMPVLQVLQEIAQAAASKGTPVMFDLYAPSFNTLQFSTYLTQRGVDHSSTSASPVTLSPTRGNVRSGRRGFDYSQTASYLYCTGTGTGPNITSTTVSDTSLINISPFGRREALVNITAGHSTSGALDIEANMALRDARPKKAYELVIDGDKQGSEYGLYWRFGDLVATEFGGDTDDVRIDEVEVTVEGGLESFSVVARVTT